MHLYIGQTYDPLKSLLSQYSERAAFNYLNVTGQMGVNVWLIHIFVSDSNLSSASVSLTVRYGQVKKKKELCSRKIMEVIIDEFIPVLFPFRPKTVSKDI